MTTTTISKEKKNMDLTTLDPFATGEEIIQYEQSNPFFVTYSGNDIKYTKNKFLYEEYKNVYFLCLDDQFEETPENRNLVKLFFEADSEISELTGQAHLVTLVKGPFILSNITTIRNGLVVIEKKIIESFNHQCYELRNKEMVYCMLNFRKRDLMTWIKIYQEDSYLEEFIRKKYFSFFAQCLLHGQRLFGSVIYNKYIVARFCQLFYKIIF